MKNLLDTFLKDVATLCEDFARDMPQGHEAPTEDALAFIANSKQAVEDTRKRVSARSRPSA